MSISFYRSFSLKMKLTVVFTQVDSTSVWFESINFPLKIAISFTFLNRIIVVV